MKNQYKKIQEYYRPAFNELFNKSNNAISKFNSALMKIIPLLNVPNNKEPINMFSEIVVGKGIAIYYSGKHGASIKYYQDLLNDRRYITDRCCSAIYNNLGIFTTKKKDATNLFIKSIHIDSNNLKPHKNLARVYKRYSKNGENHTYTLKYLKQLIYINEININVNKSNKIYYDINLINVSIQILASFPHQKKWLAINVDKDINPLLYDTRYNNNLNKFSDVNLIINLFKLVKYSLCFLSNHLIKQSPKELLYQYTSINTLKSVCNVDKTNPNNIHDFKLRLYNSDYMNDPLEGKELLKDLIHIDDSNNGNNCVRDIINSIYHNDDIKYDEADRNVISLHGSHVYIASLSDVNPGDNDSMSLWNSYSDNHKGISLGLDIKINKKTESKGDTHVANLLNSFNDSSSYANEIPLNLYKVSYDVDDFNNPEVLDRLSYDKHFYESHIKDKDVKNHKYFYNRMLKKLKNVIKRIKNIRYLNDLLKIMNKIPANILNKSDQVFKLVKLNLDKIRFLSKSGVYKYENEIRVMEEIPKYTKIHYDSGNEKLYVNLDSKKGIVSAKLKRIVFGNRCKSYYWVPMVEKQLPNVQMFKSNIKYR